MKLNKLNCKHCNRELGLRLKKMGSQRYTDYCTVDVDQIIKDFYNDDLCDELSNCFTDGEYEENFDYDSYDSDIDDTEFYCKHCDHRVDIDDLVKQLENSDTDKESTTVAKNLLRLK